MKKYVVVRKIEKVVVSGSRGLQKTQLTDSSALRCRPDIDMASDMFWSRIAGRQWLAGMARSAWY